MACKTAAWRALARLTKSDFLYRHFSSSRGMQAEAGSQVQRSLTPRRSRQSQKSTTGDGKDRNNVTAALLRSLSGFDDAARGSLAGQNQTGMGSAVAAASLQQHREDAMQTAERADRARGMYRTWQRNFQPGQVYAPHDLSSVEMQKSSSMNLRPRMRKVRHDVFDQLGMNPLDLYKNYSVMSEFCTPLGRIMTRAETGLRPVNQRRLAKAIKRAIGMGLMPSVHKHPEILEEERVRRLNRRSHGLR